MPTFNQEAQRIKQELDTIETVLRDELKKTLIGRWLAKVVLDKNWQHVFQWRNAHKKERDPVLHMFEHDEMGE